MRTLGDLGELELIARIRRRAVRPPARQWSVTIGDDAAVLRPRRGEELAVTTDSLVEGVHFRFDNQAARTIGRRALHVNLSDLAAMGARPLGFTLALCAPPSLALARFDAILAGLLFAARRHGCPLVGGNVSSGGELSLGITAFGAVASGRALRRDALRAGDRLFVTGTVGGAALARLRAERRGGRLTRVPEPRLKAGRRLVRLARCGGCIDVSDGLAADLEQMLVASGVGAELDITRVPTPPGFVRACAGLGLDPLALCLAGGEDYELLFSLRSGARVRVPSSRQLGVRATEIGRVTSRLGLRGVPRIGPLGWRHF